MDLFGKVVDLFTPFLQNRGYFQQNYGFLNKIVDLFNKIVDFLFRKRGSSAPREPPGYGPAIVCLGNHLLVYS